MQDIEYLKRKKKKKKVCIVKEKKCYSEFEVGAWSYLQ